MGQLVKPEQYFDEKEQILMAKRDIRQFEPLYNTYYKTIFRFVNHRMEKNDDAVDIASEVFLKAMKNLISYKITSTPFLAWLYVIAKNEVAGYYRHKKTEQRFFTGREALDELSMNTETELNENFFPVTKILETLPERDFELIELKYFNSKSIKEIAELTGMNENKIRVRIHRIRERMKKMMQSEMKANSVFESIVL